MRTRLLLAAFIAAETTCAEPLHNHVTIFLGLQSCTGHAESVRNSVLA